MKKKLLSILLTLLPLLASADAVEIDGIYYNLITKGKVAEVTSKEGGYSGDLVIPKTVTYNGVEYTVTTLGDVIPHYSNKLNSISIPSTINTIKDGALLSYNEIKINITDLEAWLNINFDGSRYPPFSSFRIFLNGNEINNLIIPQIKQINNCLFEGCKSLNTLTIPSSVEIIGNESFASCTNLFSLTIENGVSKIGDGAFLGCSGLSSVNLPNSVASIGNSSFSDCTSMESIIFSNSLETIGKSAFKRCSSLSSITIPNSISHITNDAFHGCSALISVSIPNSITSIGDGAFYGCTSLISVTFPNSVTSIGRDAFNDCISLSSVEIPPSVTQLGGFSGCRGLTSVTIPNSVTSIDSYAFQYCTGLTSVTIPNNVTHIGGSAFFECSGLTSVTIGSGVKTIDGRAFSNCENLTDVYCLAEQVPGTSSDAFKDSYPQYMTLHVPAASIEAYRSTEPWSKFGKIVALTDEDYNRTSINTLKTDDAVFSVATYSVDGRRLTQPQRGLNIIRMSDGTTKKVIIK